MERRSRDRCGREIRGPRHERFDQPDRRYRPVHGRHGIRRRLTRPGAEGVVRSGFGRALVRVAARHNGMTERTDRRQHHKRRVTQRDQRRWQDKRLPGDSWRMHHDRVTVILLMVRHLWKGASRWPSTAHTFP